MSNNFNQSSTGINIEVSIFYDGIMSQINFDENIERVKINTYEHFVYIDYGNLSSDIDLDDLITYDIEKVDMTLYNEIMGGDFDLYEWENYILPNYDLEELCEKLDLLKLPYKKHYHIITVTGYSQGDIEEVIILTDKLKELWGTETINLPNLKEEITHYFYDSPISAWVYINNEEYVIEEINGCYDIDYSKEEVINYLMSATPDAMNKDVLLSELEEIIPDEVEYL